METLNSIKDYYMANQTWLTLVMMPFTYAFVGWMTNVIALKMTFYPLKFVGIPPFIGWQGIIPKKAGIMAGKAVDVITEKLLNLEDVFDNIDPNRLEKELRPLLKEVTKDVLQDVIDDINPNLWNLLPDNIKAEILKNAQKDSASTIRNIYNNFRANLYTLFDLKGLVLKSLTGDNVKLTVDMFQEVGGKEFKFIEHSGIYFGFILGLIQVGIYSLLTHFKINANWTLPLQGILVGYLTNFLALRMIFRPLRPTKILGLFTYQGIFIRRQPEVSEKYAELVAHKILTPRKIMEEIFYGRAAEDVFVIIRKSVIKGVEASAGIAKPVISFTIGGDNFDKIKTYVVEKMISLVPETTKRLENYFGTALDLEETMSSKMKLLTPEEYEGILRAAFQEDEWMLILAGAILGGAVGVVQMLLM